MSNSSFKAAWDKASPWVLLVSSIVLLAMWLSPKVQNREIDFNRFTQIRTEGTQAIESANNAAEKELLRDRYAKVLCHEAPGGKIVGWSGRLYDVKPALFGGVYIEVSVGSTNLMSQTISKDTPLFAKVAALKPSTWTKLGAPVMIDGTFDRSGYSSGCLEFRTGVWARYYITLTDFGPSQP